MLPKKRRMYSNNGGSLSVWDQAQFFAPLKTTLVISRGTGNPTFTRATTAYVKDFEDVWREVPSGAARFEGARMVRNLCPTPSTSITAGNNKTITASVGTYVFSMGAGAGTITFTGTATGATGTLDADATNRTSATLTITVAGTIIATASVATCVDLQFENVTGASNQNPSEYVSVGVLSAPYHGAGVDGIKYFATDRSGAAIADATLKGYLAEGARTNRCLYSQDFSNAAWVSGGGGITVATNTAVAPDGTTTADTLTAAGANGTLIQDLGVVASAAKAGGLYLKRKTGTGNIDLTLDGGSTWTTVAVTSDWLLLEKTQTLADEDFGIRIVTSGDAVYAWQAQVETAAFISSPIPTTTAAVTRNGDVLTYQISGNANNVIGTAYIEVHANGLLDPTTSTCLSLTNALGQLISFVSATNAVAWDGVNSPAKTGLTSYLTGIRKRASSWGSSGISITGDGENPSTSLFDGTMGDGTGNIKIATGSEYINCKNVRIWTKQLSDAQLVQITGS